jgi:predicted secreted hydrolase
VIGRRLPWHLRILQRALIVVLLLLSSGLDTLARQATAISGDAPVPVEFPRDDGPHTSKIEWWYFTGHLYTATGARYGFEYVMFRARENDVEGFVSHFAITDPAREAFHYDQKLAGASGVRGDSAALDLNLNGWTMRGENGAFALRAAMPGYAVDLDAVTTKPPALHDGDGYIDYGNGTASYYYSWTRLDVRGTIDLGDGALPVNGSAWMDHQWGDFATYQDGGWDWFSLQLDDDTDIMLYLIRGPSGDPLRVDGTIVSPQGEVTILRPGDFSIASTGSWTSPRTGATYPSGWKVDVPQHGLALTLIPVLRDQELDTRRTTGVIYWEGEVAVQGSAWHDAISGHGYVELTGYAPYEPRDLVTPVASITDPRHTLLRERFHATPN